MPRKSKNIVVEEIEDSDVESVASVENNSDNESQTDDSDVESVSSADEEVETKKASKKKTPAKKKPATKKKPAKKKAKKEEEDEDDDEDTFSLTEAFKEFNIKIKALSVIEKSFSKLQDEAKEKGKEFKAIHKEIKKDYNVLQAKISKEWKKLEKQKRKKSGNRKKGGITAVKPVPIKLCKYLGLSVDSELPRSEVTKKCFAEFKKRDMSVGDRKYVYDKETAKVFGADKGDEFHLHSFQGILANVYKENGNSIDL